MVNLPSSSATPGDWDLGAYFDRFGGEAMQAFKTALDADIDRAALALRQLPPLDGADASTDAWAGVIQDLESIRKHYGHLASYVGCLSAADASSEAYQAEESRLAETGSRIGKLQVPLLDGIRQADDAAFHSLLDHPDLADVRYQVGRMRGEARTRMTAAKETLNEDLAVDGIHAWGRLYDKVSGNLRFSLKQPDGTATTLPISQVRSLMAREDPELRLAAFQGYTEAWESMGRVCASALNAIAGTRLTLYEHRGIGHFLEPALHDAGCGRATLDALMEAVREEIDFPREILRLKAARMQKDALEWQDLECPFPLGLGAPRTVRWQEGVAWTRRAYHHAYPALGRYFDTLVEKRWIDYQPRDNKAPGGFCTGSDITDEARIFMTFNGDMGSVTTLAHEAGHAFHHHVMRGIRPLAREYPMTLAESASTFGEAILIDGVVNDPGQDRETKLRLLDALVNSIPSYLVNLPMRYTFERALYERRAEGELSVSELKALMVETQRELYGDTLSVGGEDPWFWASKLHFYITGISFYNFPYTFGFLLSRGLYNRFRQEGPAFLPAYEAFLRGSGSMSCEDAVRETIGADLTQPAFWRESIRSLAPSFEEFRALLEEE